jgi:hypothetical protein
MKTKIFISSIFLMILSCNSASHISSLKDNSGNAFASHISYDASRRGSIIYKNDNSKIVVLSEPPPDVATTLATDLGAKVKVEGVVDTQAYLSTSKSIAELGKRTASAGMLRDALYKLSEMRLSSTLDSETMKLFEKILCSIESMHNVEMEQARSDTKVAEAKVIEAQNNKILLQNSFEENSILGAKKNYQIAIQLLLNKKFDDAKLYFKSLYSKYPIHFNIDEIYKMLMKYEGSTRT